VQKSFGIFGKILKTMERMNFTILTKNVEGYRNVMANINVCNQSDVDHRFGVNVKEDVELSEGVHSIKLSGSIDAVKSFEPKEENEYSLCIGE